jgi:hypothetical protein
LKFDAGGATYPAHSHPGGEEVFVIGGKVKLARTGYRRATISLHRHARDVDLAPARSTLKREEKSMRHGGARAGEAVALRVGVDPGPRRPTH